METGYMAKRWWSFLLRGLVAIALGIVLLVWPAATVGVIILLFGIFALIDGVIELVLSIVGAAKRIDGWGWLLVKGIVGILIGTVILVRPDVALGVVVILIAIWAIAMGFAEIAAALDMPPESGRGFVGVVGALSLILGVVILVVPRESVYLFVLLVGIYALVAGFFNVIISFFARGWEKKVEA
jgi:uncharacterized membrane protein HdeD (DUF308 family)